MTTAEFALGWLCVVVIVGMFVWIGIALHIAYTKMDLMLTHLKNCSAIMIRAPLRHGGPWGKLLLVGGISGDCYIPRFLPQKRRYKHRRFKQFPRRVKA